MENMTWLVNILLVFFFVSKACFKLVKCGFPMENMAYLVNPTWCVYS